jgi:hypothetical protein
MAAPVKQQKKLVRLISAFSDMNDSVCAAKLLLGGVPDEIYNQLFLSMVVAYTRPFTENYGVGRIQCDYPAYPEDCDDAKMLERHNRLLDLRNKFLAHSSAEGTCIQIIPPGVTCRPGSPPQPKFDFIIGKRVFPKIEFVECLHVAPVTFGKRLHFDIVNLLGKIFPDQTVAFDLPTGHEKFKWT